MGEIAVYEGKKLGELIGGISVEGKKYLSLRIRGLERPYALRVSGEFEQDEKFKELESYLIRHSAEYEEEALQEFCKTLKVKSQVLMEYLVDKGLTEWGELDRTTKIAVSGVLRMVGVKGITHEDTPGSYDELVLRRRRVIDESTNQERQ